MNIPKNRYRKVIERCQKKPVMQAMTPKYRNNHKGSAAFKSFIPPKMDDYCCDSPEIKPLTDEVTAKFSELNGLLANADKAVLEQLIEDEAADSLKLSSEKVNSPFAFVPVLTGSQEKENIIRAIDYGVGALEELPLSRRLITNLHYLVCDSPEYDRKYRGEIRRSPVWIGKKGCGIADATFIPPVDEDLEDGLTDLENFINCSDDNIFVKAALIHYQFEMLHPFIDANGRVGRILNALFLKENKVLNHPTLLSSKELLSTEKLYNEKIQSVNDGGDINDWIIYFLKILNLAAESTIVRL